MITTTIITILILERVEGNARIEEYISSLCLLSVCLLFSVFCSLFPVNQSISTVICSSQLYSEGGGGRASQPRSKRVARVANSIRGVAPENHAHASYILYVGDE